MSEEIKNNEINLSEVDWNKLSVEQFHDLEQKLIERQKESKKFLKKDKRNAGCIHVKLNGKLYLIKEVLYQRLKSMKSKKSKDKLINEIISSHNSIENLD